ncbi:MAG TPA: metallophosphoesterase [Chloroflexia bacterium]|nr:metallophosphoesterase [Chloroflexia bacterium]
MVSPIRDALTDMAGRRANGAVGRELTRAALAAFGALGVTGAGMLAYATGIEPHWIELKHVDITLPRLPAQFDGYRIVHLSDIHAGIWLPDDRLEQVAGIVNAQDPDLVAITGDFVTLTYLEAPDHIVPEMQMLRARDGVVAVLGNHDYWGILGHRQIRYVIRESRMIDLNNDVRTLERDGAVLHLAGVDSAREHMARPDIVLRKLPREGATILLAHEPDFADVTARAGRFDLQLSGHSHGGQVVVPAYGPPHLPPMGKKYHTGRYRIGNMVLYTNRGLGVVGLPVRFFCRPEISVITLRSPRV